MPPKFKPGGKRFPPKVTARPVPQQVQPPPGSSEPSTSGLDLETENKFELELCWCIQQLELSMNSSKLGDKQIRDVQKSLRLLKSNVPLVQKRQIMRTTFGDYRAKMLQEEKKHNKSASTVKIITPKPSENKSVFLKKAKGLTECEGDNSRVQNGHSFSTNLANMFRQSHTEERFQFNFTAPDVN